jgi:glycosyltransferase involved in cell wall biosynthesis
VRALRREEVLSARFADRVIATNTLHETILAEHGIPARKIDIIMNVGNEDIFKPAETPSADRPLTLAYHGTIAERLGLDLIVRALAVARNDCPDVRLILIGEGDFLPEVRALVRELGLDDAVDFVPFVAVEELPSYLARADVGVVGNRAYTEQKRNYMLPVKMLEYAAMEIPTIAPRLRAIRAYFDDESAFFYQPDDVDDMARQIVRACRDRDLLAETKPHLRRFNKRYNWAAMEREYMSIVSGLLAGRADQAAVS